MLTAVIRPATDSDRYIPLHPNVVIEARRLLFLQGNIRDIAECAYHYRTTFECTETYESENTAVITMRNQGISIRFVIRINSPITMVQIDKNRYTIELADLMPYGKEIP